jgi:hypothetical protein
MWLRSTSACQHPAQEEVTAHTYFGTVAKVHAAVDLFFAGLAARTDDVKRR